MKILKALLLSLFAALAVPALAQTVVVSCGSGFNNGSSACSLGPNTGGPQDFFSTQANRSGTYLNGTMAVLNGVNAGHNGNSIIRQTKVSNLAWTATWTFIPNGNSPPNFVLEDQTNQNGAAFNAGAGGEGGFYQGAGGTNIAPNNVFALKFSQNEPTSGAGGAFDYSNVMWYQTLESPGHPPYGGSPYLSSYEINSFSTSPVPLNSPPTTSQSPSGDTYSATLTYNHGTGTLTLALYDVTASGTCTPVTSGTCFYKTWTNVWIPEIDGATTAWVGFTSGTNGVTSPETDVNSLVFTVNTPSGTPTYTAWNAGSTYNNGTVSTSSPVYSVAPGTYSAPQVISVTTSTTPHTYNCVLFSSTTPTLYPYPDNNGGCQSGTYLANGGTVTVSTSGTLYAVSGANNSAFGLGNINPTGLGPPSTLVAASYVISAAASGVSFGAGVSLSSGIGVDYATPVIVANTTPTCTTGTTPACEPTSAITMSFGGYSLPVYLAKTQAVYPSVTQTTLGTASWGQVSWNGASTNVVIGYTSAVTSATIQTIQGGVPVNITPTISGSTITFPYSGTGQVLIVVNNDPFDPIYLFANPLEVNPPSPTGPNVQNVTPGVYNSEITFTGSNTTFYFGPGIYNLNAALPLQHLGNNMSIYIADGAFVYGSGAMVGLTNLIAGTGSNISVTGRGVVDLSKAPSNTSITAYSISGSSAPYTFTATTGVGSKNTGNTFVGGESITLSGQPTAISGLTGTYTVLSSPAPTSGQFQFQESTYSSGSGSGYSNFQGLPDGGLRPNILSLSGGSSSGTNINVDGLIFRDSPSITATISSGTGGASGTVNNLKEFGWRPNSDGFDYEGFNGTVTNGMCHVYDDCVSPKSENNNQNTSSLNISNYLIFVSKATALRVGSETVDTISGVTFQGARISSYNTENTPLLCVCNSDQGTTSNITVDSIYIDVLNQALMFGGISFGLPGYSTSVGNGNPGLVSGVTFSHIYSPTVPQTPAINVIGYGPSNTATGIQFNYDTINGANLTSSGVTSTSYTSFTVFP